MGYIRKRTRTDRAIIRYPRFSVEADPEKYYQSLLQLFLPYQNEKQLKPGQFVLYEDFYKNGHVKFETSEHSIAVKTVVDSNMSHFVKNSKALELAVQQYEQQGPQEDAWAQLCPETENERLQCNEEGKISTETNEGDPESDIPDLCNSSSKDKQSNLSAFHIPTNEIMPFMRFLNNQQKKIFYKIRQWCLDKSNGMNPDPFHVFITGGAGTGKSHLIKCLYYEATRLLQPCTSTPDDISVLLTAPTGTAAFNIGGMTIHSALSIYKSLSVDHATLSEDKLNTLRAKLDNVQIIIIDEISMVNKVLLYFVHERLRQIKKTPENSLFGGVSVIAVGDFYQLPPVKTKKTDKLYVNDASNPLNNLWNDLFSIATLDEIMRQKDDEIFAGLLNRLRIKEKQDEISVSDLNMLQECMNDGPDEVLHIFSTNAEIQNYNNAMVMKYCAEPKLIEAVDYEKDKTTGTLKKKRSHFQKVETQLPVSILLSEGARVMLIKNEDVNDGLVNGVMGTVIDICPNDIDGLPSLIYINFDNAKVGQNSKSQKIIKGKRCIGIVPSLEDIAIKNGKRKQFPIQLAFACTAHKVQGLTVSEVVVDLSKCFSCGQAYVALSRVTSKNGLHLNFMESSKLQKKVYSDPDIKEGIASMGNFLENDPQATSKSTITILYHNIQGLGAHLNDLKSNVDMTKADYICLVETWLQPNSVVEEMQGFKLCHLSRSLAYSNTGIFESLKNMKNGGIGVYVKENSPFEDVAQMAENLECIIFRIPIINTFILTVYRTQKYPVTVFIENLHSLLTKLSAISQNILICGDFNQDLLKNESSIQNSLTSKGFQQMIEHPTTERGTLIDHVYVKGISPKKIGIIPTYYSYHEAISIEIETGI